MVRGWRAQRRARPIEGIVISHEFRQASPDSPDREMVGARVSRASRSERAKKVLYSSAVLSIVASAVAVLGAPFKWM
jgi:hypothetical protein